MAKGILRHAKRFDVLDEGIEKFVIPSGKGRGVHAKIAGKSYFLGNAALLKANEIEVPDNNSGVSNETNQDEFMVYLAEDKQVVGRILLKDRIREEATEAIAYLKKQGYEIYMLTGSPREDALNVASQLGIDVGNVKADRGPIEKKEFIESLKSDENIVAMVGDDVNDLDSLKEAHVGFAMGLGPCAGKEYVNANIYSNSLKQFCKAIDIAKQTTSNITENVVIAFLYNIIAIPLAAFAFINPIIAAGLMILESSLITLNVYRLRYKSVPDVSVSSHVRKREYDVVEGLFKKTFQQKSVDRNKKRETKTPTSGSARKDSSLPFLLSSEPGGMSLYPSS